MTKLRCALRLALAVILAASAMSCSKDDRSAEPGDNKHAASGPVSPADTRPVHEVRTAEELIQAIGPDRVIKLTGKDYSLTGVTRRKLKHVRWRKAHQQQYDVMIRNCPNLTIEGSGETRPHVFVSDAYAHVLNFESCAGLSLRRLKLGHHPDPGYCMGGVVSVTDSNNVLIEDCILYGCGTTGLTLRKSHHLTFRKSVIERCTYGILSAEDCDDLRFEQAVFRENMRFSGFSLTDCVKTVFVDCTVQGNVLGGLKGCLFETNLNSRDAKISFKGGNIEDNAAVDLARPRDMLTLDGATMAKNSWQAPPEVQARRGKKTPAAKGGWHYVVPVGEATFWDVSIEVYGRGWFSQALQKANPDVREPIRPDTRIYCPPDPPKDVYRG